MSYKPYYPPQLGDPPLYVPGKPPTPGANAIVGAPVSFHPRVVNEIAPASVPGLVKPFLVTSSWGYPHERTANNIAKLGNVSIRIQIPGQPDVILKPDNIRNKFNKTFLIHSVTARRQFLIDVTGQEWGENYSCFSVGDKALGTAHMGMSAGNGTGSVVEGNHLLHCYNSGPWADTGNTPDLTARHNYYYDIAKGPFQNMGVWRDENNRLPCNLSHDSLIATCDTSPLPHGLTVGQAIRISGTAQDNAKQYDGDFTVKSVSATNKNQFAYDLSDQAFQSVIHALKRISGTQLLQVMNLFAEVASLDGQASFTHENCTSILLGLLNGVDGIQFNLKRMSFSLNSFREIKLSNISFEFCYFSQTSLEHTTLKDCRFENCHFARLDAYDTTELINVVLI